MARAQYSWRTLKVAVSANLFLIHAIGVTALFFWNYAAFKAALVVMFFTLWVGVSMGNHRLFTHKSFKAPRWVENAIAWCSTASGQGSIIWWTAVHLAHHKESDGPDDPHSPRDGLWWSHMLWLCFDSVNGVNPLRYVPARLKTPTMRWFNRYAWIPHASLYVVMFTAGALVGGIGEGAEWFLWGGWSNMVSFHITWIVNSACHKWGYKNTASGADDSRNLWWAALLTGGEGWHANHHDDPSSASHGWKWWEVDPIYWMIVLMSWIGLASEVRRPRHKRKSKPVQA